MTDPKINHRIHWVTVAVTVLPPGWRNVYADSDSKRSEYPCPAVLLQEERGTHKSWIDPRPGREGRRHEFEAADPPYDTRVVFANWDGPELDAVDDASNYVETLPPGEPGENTS